MQKFFLQLHQSWGRLSLWHRLCVIGALIGTVSFLGVIIYVGSMPEYGVLFSDLRATDAQAIVEKLKAANVPYQLSNNGSTVSVPNERISEMRLQMASAGVITGGRVGFDLFDKSSFGITDFSQRVNYQRALEGELARTIEGMDEVENARIHITAPRESVFADKDQPAKASVMLRMKLDKQMSRERTDSIVNLVASAVEGLSPDNVAVMDSRGRLLTAIGRDQMSGTGAFNNQIEARQRLEMETATRIVSLLEPIVGAGHVRADVAADIDFSRVEQTDEKYNPQSSVMRSQQTSEEIRNSNANLQGGLVGARANDPALRPTPTPAAGANPTTPNASPTPAPTPFFGDQRKQSTTNWEIDKTVRHTVGNGGILKRLSTAVIVDYKMVDNNSVPRSADELKKLQDTISAAIGIDTQRGDQIVVQSLAFQQTPAEAAATLPWWERFRDLIRIGIKYGLLVFAALLLIFFGFRPLRRSLAAIPKTPQLTEAQLRALSSPQTVSELAASSRLADSTESVSSPTVNALPPKMKDEGPHLTVAEIEAQMQAEIEHELATQAAPVVKRASAIKKTLVERTQKDPETIAVTIRSWLKDRDNR